MDISIIVPLFNEAESLTPLYEWIAQVMVKEKKSCEIIFVNDGSTDNSWQVIKQLQAEKNDTNIEIKGICFRRN